VLGLHVASGSLDEEEDQRGICHFLEHLAFRGSANFPPGALQVFFESLGTRLGRHHNAYTGLDRTCFRLSLPVGSEANLEKGLACLADFAHRLTLPPQAVETERKVILEEMRAREGVSSRIKQKLLSLLMPGSRISRRHPLGVEESVRRITAEQIRAHYERWYRPEKSTLIVVGDVDPTMMEPVLLEHFGDWRSSTEPPATPDPDVRPPEATRAAVITDPEVTEGQVWLLAVRPFTRRRTVAEHRAKLIEETAVWMLNQRLGALIQMGRAPFRNALTSVDPLVQNESVVRAIVSGSTGHIEPMLHAMASELRRVRLHGFLDGEMDAARRHVRSRARRAVLDESGRSAELLLRELTRAASDGQPPMSKEQNLALVERFLPSVTLEEPLTAFYRLFNPSTRLVLAIVPEGDAHKPATEEELLAVLRDAEGADIPPPTAVTRVARLLDRAPVAGMVVSKSEDPDLDLLSVTLANGVRAHLRTMNYRKNQVFVRLNLAGGRICETETDVGITAAGATALTQPASEKLSSVDIRDLMTGKGVELEAAVQEDAIHFLLTGSSGELEEGFQLLHLLLTQAKIEEPALRRWQAQMEEYGRGRNLDVEARLAQESLRLITGGDHRFRLITHEEALAITMRQAQQRLQNMIRTAPIEMAVVGDMERGTALDMVLQFIGSLEPRPVDDPSLDDLRRLGIEDGPFTSTLEVEMVAPRAAILSGWRVAPWSPARERQLMQMAEQVLMKRLQDELREKRGLTYGADCSFNPSRAYPEASLLTVTFYAPPDRADEAVSVTRDLVESLAAQGPTDAEMEAIRKQLDDLITRAQNDPRYWCRVLSDLHYHGTRLDDLKNLHQRVLSFSGRDMQAVLENYITEKRRFEVVCLPR